MNKFLKIFIAAIMGLMLVSCKNAPEVSVVSKAKKIGLVSFFRDQFSGLYIGTTIFHNKQFLGAKTGWGLTSASKSYILNTLSRNGSFSIRPVHGADKLIQVQLDSLHPFSSGSDLKSSLNILAKQQGFDTLLILEPVTLDQKGFRISKVGEYGIYQRYSFVGGQQCVFLKYSLSLYNVRRNETIGTRITSNLPFSGGGVASCPDENSSYKITRLAESLNFRESFTAYSSSEKTVMRDKIKTQLISSLKKDLECLKLKKLKNGLYRKEGCGVFDR